MITTKSRRIDLSGFSISIFSLAFGLFMGAILIIIADRDPILGYYTMVESSLSTPQRIGEMVIKITPFALAGLGIAIGFKGGYWNIGAEGQIIIGALSALGLGYFINLPQPLHVTVIMIVGLITGGGWSLISGILKAKLGVNEVLTTLMLNYVAVWLSEYFIVGPWSIAITGETPVFARTVAILDSAKFPKIFPGTRAHLGVIMAMLLPFVIYYLLHRTALGFKIRAVGENPRAARIAGINVSKMILTTSFMSGALAGLAGVSEVLGVHFFLERGFVEGYGYTSIAVATLGGLHPIGTLLSAIFFGFLINGASYMQRGINIPATTVQVFIGLLILSMLMAPIFKKYIIRLVMKEKRTKEIRIEQSGKNGLSIHN